MTFHQHEHVYLTADQLVQETEWKIEQQLTLIELLVTSGKKTGNEMKQLTTLFDTLDGLLEYIVMEQEKLNRN